MSVERYTRPLTKTLVASRTLDYYVFREYIVPCDKRIVEGCEKIYEI